MAFSDFPLEDLDQPIDALGSTVCYALPQDAALTDTPLPTIIKVRASDSAGVFSPIATTRVLIDWTAPPKPVVAGGTLLPSSWGNPASPTVQFSAAPSTETWTYTLDAGPEVAATESINLSGLAAGYHNLTVVREDRSGNSSSSSLGFGVGAAPAPSTCSTDGLTPTEVVELEAEVSAGLASGELDAVTAAAIRCRPSVAPKGASVALASTSEVVTPTAAGSSISNGSALAGSLRSLETASTSAASGCWNPRIISEQSVWGRVVWTFTININHCYTGTKVYNASTGRSFKVSNWGKLIGIGWSQYLDETKFYYSLNGVSNAAYRYTQSVRWTTGGRLPALGWECDAIITERVYGNGTYKRAATKCA